MPFSRRSFSRCWFGNYWNASRARYKKNGRITRYMPLTYLLMLIGSLSLMGIPFLSGFYSKDLILLAVNEVGAFLN